MNHIALSGLLVCISSLISSSLVYFKAPKKNISIPWSLFSFCVALWGFGLFRAFIADDKAAALFWSRFLNLAAIFIPIFFFHFAVVFSEKLKTKKLELSIYYILAIIYFSFATILHARFIPDTFPIFNIRYYPSVGSLYHLFPMGFGYFVIYGVFLLWKGLTISSRRNQTAYLLSGIIVGFAGGGMTFLPMYGIRIYPYGTYLVTVYVLTVAYAIIKYRLMSIEVLLWRGFLLVSAFLLALAAGYVSFYVMGNVSNVSPRVNAGISGAWMLAVFGILLWRLNEAVFKKEDMSLAALKDASLEMVVFPDPVRLSAEICKRVFQTLEPTYAHIYLVDERREKYQLQYLLGEQGALKETLGSSDCIVNWFLHTASGLLKKNALPQKAANILFYHNIVEKWLTNKDFLNKADNLKQTLLEIKQQMEKMQAIVIVAASYKRNLYEFLILGEKKNGFYTPGDLEILSSLSRIAAMNIRNALTIADLHTKVRDKTALIQEMASRTIQMVLSFNKAVDARDPYTAEHSEEVFEIVSWIAEEMGLPMTLELKFSANLHDIGKIGISDQILLKTSKLNDVEFERMKKHPEIGYEILRLMDFFTKVSEIVYCHQERYDGKGYPRGLKGEEIPIEARIIAVSDAYHAMTSDRPYRKALPMPDVVRELLKGRAKQFDPDVVDALIRRLVKMRMVSRKDIKYLYSEEALVPIENMDDFLKKPLHKPIDKELEELEKILTSKEASWALVSSKGDLT